MPWAFPRHSLTLMAQCRSADASVARLAYQAQEFNCAQASPRPVADQYQRNLGWHASHVTPRVASLRVFLENRPSKHSENAGD